MILAIRTDKPEAEIYLYSLAGEKSAEHTWQAHRELSNTLLEQIEQLLHANTLQIKDLEGIVVFQGPGSFTGLRIGITVANTLAYAQSMPVVGSTDDNWVDTGLQALASNNAKQMQIVIPEYGAPAHITKPRK